MLVFSFNFFFFFWKYNNLNYVHYLQKCNFFQNLRLDSIKNAQSITDPRKRMTAVHVLEEYQTKKARVEEINQDLKGKQICIVRGTSDVTIQDLQEIIVSFGGIHVANPGFIQCFTPATFFNLQFYS